MGDFSRERTVKKEGGFTILDLRITKRKKRGWECGVWMDEVVECELHKLCFMEVLECETVRF